MRKLFSFILAAVTAFLMSVCAFADVEGPQFYKYEVIVSNLDGAKGYYYYYGEKQDIVIPYQTELIVNYEFNSNNTLMVSVDYNSEECEIKYSDVSKKVSQVGPEYGHKLSKTVSTVVINPNGTPLRDGPADSYQKITTIPYGTILNSNYDSSENYPGWSYVTYNGYSGWIFSYEPDSAECASVVENPEKCWVEILDKGHYIYDKPYVRSVGKQNRIGEIAPGTKLYYKYTYFDEIYVEYNGIKGWITPFTKYGPGRHFDCVVYDNSGVTVKNTKGISLYKKPFLSGETGEKILTIPNGAKMNTLKCVICGDEYENTNYWYFVNYNDHSGWITGEGFTISNTPFKLESKTNTVTIKADTTSGTSRKFDSDTIATTSATSAEQSTSMTSEFTDANVDLDVYEAPDFIDETKNDNFDKDDDMEKKSTMNHKTIIALCVLGAVAVSLAAAVTVIFVNKKKNNNI